MWIPLFIFLTVLSIEPASENFPISDKVTFTIMYDNYVIKEGTKSDWGFSCLIEGTEKTVLFDTGTKADILKHNFETLEIDLSIIDLLIFSHNHRDHTGGMIPVLDANPEIPVYILPTFTSEIKNELGKHKAKVIPVLNFTEICQDVYLTGVMGDQIKEQSLIVDTPKGLIIVTGCSHQGVVSIIRKSIEELDKPVHLVFGGFHLLRHSEKEIKSIISEFHQLGVQKCGPTHCTGDNAIALFKSDYAENFVSIGTGKVIEIELR